MCPISRGGRRWGGGGIREEEQDFLVVGGKLKDCLKGEGKCGKMPERSGGNGRVSQRREKDGKLISRLKLQNLMRWDRYE